MPTITTPDGCPLFVKDWGAGRPVIMLHGWPLSADTFDDLAMTLAEGGVRAIAYDRRGFGRSGQPWHGYDYDTLADDLAAVIEATGADDVTPRPASMSSWMLEPTARVKPPLTVMAASSPRPSRLNA